MLSVLVCQSKIQTRYFFIVQLLLPLLTTHGVPRSMRDRGREREPGGGREREPGREKERKGRER
jgi:hypothetical protein